MKSMHPFLVTVLVINQVYLLVTAKRHDVVTTPKYFDPMENVQTNQILLLQTMEIMKKEISRISLAIENLLPSDCSGEKIQGKWQKVAKIKLPKLDIKEVQCDQQSMGGGWTVVVARDAERKVRSEMQSNFNSRLSFGKTSGRKRAHHRNSNTNRLSANDENIINYSAYDLESSEGYHFINFNRTWEEYKNGFGDPYNEYWIGNAALHALTKDSPWEVLVQLEDWKGSKVQAVWDNFRVSDEQSMYRLEISGYKKEMSNLKDGLTYHAGKSFSTFDSDNDNEDVHCAMKYGGGWWFHACHVSHLTGTHLSPGRKGDHAVHWLPWKANPESLKKAKLMIRPKNISR